MISGFSKGVIMSEFAVIIVDMLNDFVTGALRAERASNIISNIQKLLTFARERGMPVIYTNDAHAKKIDKEFQLWGEHAIAGTKGAQVIDELKPKDGDYVISKRRYSGFFGTDLDLLLRELGAKNLIVTGIATDICVQHTVADAYFRGYDVLLPEDGVQAFTDEEHKYGLEYAKRCYNAEILRTDDLIKRLSSLKT